MPTALLDRIAARIPEEARPLVARLLSDPPRPPGQLVDEVDAYAGFVRQYAATHPGVDVATADRLAARCLALIARMDEASEDQRRLVQAACLYLVAIEGDLDAGAGFDDDEAVIAAVEAALDAPA